MYPALAALFSSFVHSPHPALCPSSPRRFFDPTIGNRGLRRLERRPRASFQFVEEGQLQKQAEQDRLRVRRCVCWRRGLVPGGDCWVAVCCLLQLRCSAVHSLAMFKLMPHIEGLRQPAQSLLTSLPHSTTYIQAVCSLLFFCSSTFLRPFLAPFPRQSHFGDDAAKQLAAKRRQEAAAPAGRASANLVPLGVRVSCPLPLRVVSCGSAALL